MTCALLFLAIFVLPEFAQCSDYPWQIPGPDAVDSTYDQQGAAGRWSNPAPANDQPAFDYALPHPDAAPYGRGADMRPGYGPPPPGTRYPGRGDPRGANQAPSHAAPQGVGKRAGAAGPWTGRDPEGYRFRGDDAANDGPWQELPNAPGFRFRPLTPDEAERAIGTDGWRPLGRDDRRAAQPVEPDAGGAYDYRPDSWFGKYYGDRP